MTHMMSGLVQSRHQGRIGSQSLETSVPLNEGEQSEFLGLEDAGLNAVVC